MRTITEMKQERATLLSAAEALLDLSDAEDRVLSADEQSRYDAAVANVTRLNGEIERELGAQRPVFRGQPGDMTHLSQEIEAFDSPRARSVPRFHPGAKLQAFANTREGHAQAYRSGQWLRAALLGDPRALNWCERNAVQVDVRAAHSAGENVKGGVLVPEEFSANILRLVDEYGVFRRNTRVVPMSTDTLNIPRRTGGLTAHYVGENQEGAESDSAWDNVQLVAKKLMILSRMSSEIAEDAIISMADMLAMECALAFALKEDTVGFTGTGISTDGGIVGVLVKALDAAHTKAKVAAASGHDTLAEIDGDDLIKLMAAIPQYAKPRSKFYCSPVALELVFNAIKVGASGNDLTGLANQVEPRFLGYPIELSEVFAGDAAATYNGAVVLGFGNLAQASTLGSRREIRFATTDARYWEQDQIGVKATLRHDINVHDLGSTVKSSPFAVLVGTT
jgi:HK97 family phage major capsid protein